ncbi:MAG: MlaD family protein [Saprospiraceae bacterium]|nr:MlaD family protein [Saprospiraceae bacterium]
MSKESRIALFAIFTIAILILGYKFIIGKNVLTKSQFFYVKYQNIDQLQVSNPVMINGYEIGSVNDIYLDPMDNTTPIVVLEIQKKIKVPKNSKAELMSLGLMGGKAIQLKLAGKCDTDCAQSGDSLIASSQSLLSSFVGEGEIDEYMDKIKTSASQLFDSVAGESGKKEIKQGVRNFERTLENLAQSTTQLNSLLLRNSNKLDKLITNLESIVGNIQKSNTEITNILKNVDAISAQVQKADASKTLGELNTTLEEGKKAIQKLQSTMQSADATLMSVNTLIKKANAGDGTVSKLLEDPKLYQNLSSTSKQLELLLQDVRLNPKRYINVSVFGKKQKEYQLAEDDPALKSDSLQQKK